MPRKSFAQRIYCAGAEPLTPEQVERETQHMAYAVLGSCNEKARKL